MTVKVGSPHHDEKRRKNRFKHHMLSVVLKPSFGIREMALWLGVGAALAEAPDEVPSTHMVVYTYT